MPGARLTAGLVAALALPAPAWAAWPEPKGQGLAIVTVEAAASHGRGPRRHKTEVRLWTAYGLTEGVTLLGQAMTKHLTPERDLSTALMLGGRLRLAHGDDWVLAGEVRGGLGDLGQFGTGAREHRGADIAAAFGYSRGWLGWPGFSVIELGVHQPLGAGVRRIVTGQTMGIDVAPGWQVITESHMERAVPAAGAAEWRNQISARLTLLPGISLQAGPYLRLHTDAGTVTEREIGGFLGLWLTY